MLTPNRRSNALTITFIVVGSCFALACSSVEPDAKTRGQGRRQTAASSADDDERDSSPAASGAAGATGAAGAGGAQVDAGVATVDAAAPETSAAPDAGGPDAALPDAAVPSPDAAAVDAAAPTSQARVGCLCGGSVVCADLGQTTLMNLCREAPALPGCAGAACTACGPCPL